MANLVPTERIESLILLIRGHKVMLDADLAVLYGVETKALNQAVKRNLDRFPEDFMFRLTPQEVEDLRFHFGTSSLRSQFVTSKSGRGGRRHPPYVLTEQGVAMLSSVLRSRRAIQVNVEIMRTFVRLRQLLASNAQLARKLEVLGKSTMPSLRWSLTLSANSCPRQSLRNGRSAFSSKKEQQNTEGQ